MGTISFAPAFSPQFVNTDTMELHHVFTESEYRKALNLAIESVKDGRYLIDKTDTSTITLSADTFEYTLPTDMYYIHRITTEEEAGGGTFNCVIDPRVWSLISSRKLKLDEALYGVTAGLDLRVEGQGVQVAATADTDTILLPFDWLIQKAITFLPLDRIQSNKLDKTYQRALIASSDAPRNYPDPRSQKVIE